MTEILPPLIIHDGSNEAKRTAKFMLALCPPSVEVVDYSTPEGQKRVDEINRGLVDGTLDTVVPPIVLTLDPGGLVEASKVLKRK